MKEEVTAGDELDGKEIDGKGEEVYKAERNLGPYESEAVNPTGFTLPDAVTFEPDVVPVVHSDVWCNGCGVCTSLRSDCFRRWSDYYGLGIHRKVPSQAHVGYVSSVLTTTPMTFAAGATRKLNTITAC